ncbi:MAG: MATE family efflux transporter [Crocosphaera sp.]|nr:MATE family efflux transporter [Crocosphaera sp.]
MFAHLGKDFKRHKRFYRSITSVGIPVILQYLVSYSLNLVDGIMVGQLGEESIVAVGVANQSLFSLLLVLFGIANGAGILIAQYWGSRNNNELQRIVGIAAFSGLFVTAIFVFLVFFMPEQIAKIFTKEQKVITLVASYFSIVCWSYFGQALSIIFSCVFRSIGSAHIPMMITFVSLGINTLLNYLLIFGKWNVPNMGLEGAALATLISRIIEAVLFLQISFSKNHGLKMHLGQLFRISPTSLIRFYQTVSPLVASELLWALGVTIYMVVYGRIGIESLVAINISYSIQNMALVIFMGLNESCSTLLGNLLGEKQQELAYQYAKRFLLTVIGISIVVSIGVLIAKGLIISQYQISSKARLLTDDLLTIFALMLWSKACSWTLLMGILRSGGDTRFVFLIDAGSTWFYGIPVAILAGLVLNFSVTWVYSLIFLEEIFKIALALRRMLSKRWIIGFS